MNRDQDVNSRAAQLRAVLGPAVLPDTWFTMLEAAKYMKVSYKHVAKACKKGLLPCAHIGRRRVLKRPDCDAYMDSKRAA